MAKRLMAMGQPNYSKGFEVATHESSLSLPCSWKKPQMIFVNSMSDLFHQEIEFEFIQRVFEVMNKASWHTYQILTKRSKRLIELNSKMEWSPHIWMGVTVENSEYLRRIDDLRQTNARIKFISFEPLLGPVKELDLSYIDWVIVGGESGPYARPIKSRWVKEIKTQCIDAKVPFFFKQWGGVNKKKNGRSLEGRTWDEMPPINATLSDNPH